MALFVENSWDRMGFAEFSLGSYCLWPGAPMLPLVDARFAIMGEDTMGNLSKPSI